MALFFKGKKEVNDRNRSGAITPPQETNSSPDHVGVAVPPADPELERRTIALGKEFLANARASRTSLLSAGFWSDKLMDWSMKDEEFKVQLFRFVDAFPMLRTPEQVHSHLVDYLSQPGVTPHPVSASG